MTNYKIENFWNRRVACDTEVKSQLVLAGWSFEERGWDTFYEAPLSLSGCMESTVRPR